MLLTSVALLSSINESRAQQINAVRIDIPAGNMTSALNRLATQAGLQMIFDAAVTGGVKNRSVSGSMTPQQALEHLLSGTRIEYRFIGEKTVKVEAPSPASTAMPSGTTVLDTITVMGNRANFNGNATSVTELNSAAIEKAQAASLPQLLAKTPGVNAGGGVRLDGQTITIRGFARQSDVRIMLDGAPKNFEKYDQGTVFIEPELLKRVEVQKGATSVRYGNGGFGGTILLDSKTAKDMLREGESWGFWGKTGYQTANRQFTETGTIYGKSDFGGPVTYDGLFSTTWRRSDNMRIGGGEVYQFSDSELTTFSANAGAEYDGHELRAAVTYGESQNWGPVAAIRGQLSIVNSDITKYGLAEARLRRLAWRELEDFSSSLKYSYSGDSDLVNVKAMASLSSTSQYAIRPDLPGVNPSASTGGYENEAKYTDLKFEVENTSNLELGGLSHMVNYGVQYNKHDRDVWMYDKVNKARPQYNYGYYTPWFMPEGTQETAAAFIRDEISVTDSIKITPGLRFDYIRSEGVPNAAPLYNNPLAGHDYSPTSHTGFTPALSARWDVTPNTTLYADWAYAMRAPNLDEIYSTQSISSKASQTARNLEAERNNNFNIGITQIFDNVIEEGDTLTASLGLFYNHVTNPVTRRFGSANLKDVADGSVPFYWNTPSYKIYGIDLQAHYETDRIFADLGLSWMNGSRKGAINDVYGPATYMNDLTPLTANAQLGYKVPDHDLSFGWNATFVDNQNRTPIRQGTGVFYARPESDGYAVHGLFLDWTPKSGFMADTEVHIALDNIFDKEYLPYLTDGISAMPGRNFKISVSRKF
jgi:hemoglobin/transferrin/lactoferrin receptor protein